MFSGSIPTRSPPQSLHNLTSPKVQNNPASSSTPINNGQKTQKSATHARKYGPHSHSDKKTNAKSQSQPKEDTPSHMRKNGTVRSHNIQKKSSGQQSTVNNRYPLHRDGHKTQSRASLVNRSNSLGNEVIMPQKTATSQFVNGGSHSPGTSVQKQTFSKGVIDEEKGNQFQKTSAWSLHHQQRKKTDSAPNLSSETTLDIIPFCSGEICLISL